MTTFTSYVVKTDNEMIGIFPLSAIDETEAIKRAHEIIAEMPNHKGWPWKLYRYESVTTEIPLGVDEKLVGQI